MKSKIFNIFRKDKNIDKEIQSVDKEIKNADKEILYYDVDKQKYVTAKVPKHMRVIHKPSKLENIAGVFIDNNPNIYIPNKRTHSVDLLQDLIDNYSINTSDDSSENSFFISDLYSQISPNSELTPEINSGKSVKELDSSFEKEIDTEAILDIYKPSYFNTDSLYKSLDTNLNNKNDNLYEYENKTNSGVSQINSGVSEYSGYISDSDVISDSPKINWQEFKPLYNFDDNNIYEYSDNDTYEYSDDETEKDTLSDTHYKSNKIKEPSELMYIPTEI